MMERRALIIKALIALFMIPFKAALSLMPTIDPPDVSALVGEIAPVWQYAGWINNYLPLAEAAQLFGVLLTAFAAVMLVRGVLWVLTKAHVLGGS